MVEPIRLAMLGPAGVGKSTLARRCQQQWGGDILSFARPLKAINADLFGDRMKDPAFARTVNQQLGVWARSHDEDVWVRQVTSRVSASEPTMVDDCRFPNEHEALRKMGFVFVRLTAAYATLRARRPDMTPRQRRHPSETEAANLPYDILSDTEHYNVELNFGMLQWALAYWRPQWMPDALVAEMAKWLERRQDDYRFQLIPDSREPEWRALAAARAVQSERQRDA